MQYKIPKDSFSDYASRLQLILAQSDWAVVAQLAADMKICWQERRRIFLCGNGGSAGNAIHLANDFLYGAGISNGIGLRVESLCANQSVITCLGNDIGYENIYGCKGIAN